MNNLSATNSSNCTKVSFVDEYGDYSTIYEVYTIRTLIHKILIPLLIALGIPGAIFSLIIWTRPKMLHTSSIYLSRLAISDIGFFFGLIIFHLNTIWKVDFMKYPVLCEVFPIIYFSMQYLSPFFTFAFTLERYILICWPFVGEKLISIKRAKIVSIILPILAVSLSLIQGYFFQYNAEKKACLEREEVIIVGTWQNQLLFYWNLIIEAFVFGFLPLTILILNVLVIKETKRLKTNKNTKTDKNNSHSLSLTAMLLTVSFYFILSTLPMTTVQILIIHSFWTGEECMTKEEVLLDPTWKSHFAMISIRSVFEVLSLSYITAKFFIYICTSKQFRRQFIELFKIYNESSNNYNNIPSSTNNHNIPKNSNSRSRRYENKIRNNDAVKQSSQLINTVNDNSIQTDL